MIPRDNPISGLLSFISSWVPDLSARHSIDGSLIPSFVPPPLRSIYELAGNYPVPYSQQWRKPRWVPGLFGTQDMLLPLDQLVLKKDRFAFIRENQSVWTCETLANEADPPVFSDASAMDGSSGEAMREVSPSLSHFLTTFCLHELAFGSQNLYCVDTEGNRPSEFVRGEIQDLWLDGMYAYKGVTYSFFLCDNDVMIMHTPMGDDTFWLAYNKDDAAKHLKTSPGIRRIH